LIDRVRQEVAKGTISSEDVAILFFSKPRIETTIHELGIDKYGNIENAPSSYRSFFLKEELNLLNRAI